MDTTRNNIQHPKCTKPNHLAVVMLYKWTTEKYLNVPLPIKLMLNCIFIKGHCLTFVVPIILPIYLLSGLVCGYFCLLRALVCGPNQADQILCLECLADVSLKQERIIFIN